MLRRLLLVATLVMLSGCGSEDETTEPTAAEAACGDFCDAARAVGCPRGGDCTSDCVPLFERGCAGMLTELLACAAKGLTDECVPRDDTGALSCGEELTSYLGCVALDFGVPPESCGPSAATSPSPAEGCQGALVCDSLDLRVSCDFAGACTCTKNGTAVGSCQSILSSAYLCAPHTSCCAPLFAPPEAG